MNEKSLLIIVIGLISSFTFLVLGMTYLYQYQPHILGYPPLAPDSLEILQVELDSIAESKQLKYDTVYIDPQIVVSREQFDHYQQEILKNKLVNVELDSLISSNLRLSDSVISVRDEIAFMRDSIKSLHKVIANNRKTMSHNLDSLSKEKSMVKKQKKIVASLEERLEQTESSVEMKYDSLETENFKTFAKIYNSSKPAEVARILEKIDEQDASAILKFMNTKKAGKVLEVMIPEQAAAILLFGSE